MSSNQSRFDKTESYQFKNFGRSNRYNSGGGIKASGIGSGGGATAAPPSSVNSNSISNNNPPLSSNHSFKKHNNVQEGQQSSGGAASGVAVISNSSTGQRPLQNGANWQQHSHATQRSLTMVKKKWKQTGDRSDSMLGDNRIEDVQWLCSLSESELDLLICLKMLMLRRAKKINPGFANSINLKVLRDLSFAMMKNLKDELKKDHLSTGLDSDESWEQLAGSTLSQNNVKESFLSMSSEELWPFICPDKKGKKSTPEI